MKTQRFFFRLKIMQHKYLHYLWILCNKFTVDEQWKYFCSLQCYEILCSHNTRFKYVNIII